MKVCDLVRGWSLEAELGKPYFSKPGRARLSPFEFALIGDFEEMADVFREVKRRRDIADMEWALPANDPSWRALDMATFALQCQLEKVGRWEDSLLDSGVDENYVSGGA